MAEKVPEKLATAAKTFAFVSIDQCDPVVGKIAMMTPPRMNSCFWPQKVTMAAYVCFMMRSWLVPSLPKLNVSAFPGYVQPQASIGHVPAF